MNYSDRIRGGGEAEMNTTVRGRIVTSDRNALLEESRKLREVARKTKACAFCDKPIIHPQRVYCSYKCAYDFSVEYYGHSWEFIRGEVLKRDGHTCQNCGRKENKDKRRYCGCEVDHIIEVADGGTDDMANLQILCSTCHRRKTNAYSHKRVPSRSLCSRVR